MESFINGLSGDFKEKIAAIVRDEILMDKNSDANLAWAAYNEAIQDDFVFGQLMHYMKQTDHRSKEAVLSLIERYLGHVTTDRHQSNA